jgi:hypothetical protein
MQSNTGNRDVLTKTQPNPYFRMIAVGNLVGLALCLAVADRATGAPPDPVTPTPSETRPTKSVNQEITNLIWAYENALNSHDPKAVMALYGSDPIFIPQNAEAFIGREAVQARYQQGTNKVPTRFPEHQSERRFHDPRNRGDGRLGLWAYYFGRTTGSARNS